METWRTNSEEEADNNPYKPSTNSLKQPRGIEINFQTHQILFHLLILTASVVQGSWEKNMKKTHFMKDQMRKFKYEKNMLFVSRFSCSIANKT